MSGHALPQLPSLVPTIPHRQEVKRPKNVGEHYGSTTSLRDSRLSSKASLASLSDISRYSSIASIPSQHASNTDVFISGNHITTSQRVSLVPTISLSDLQSRRSTISNAGNQKKKVSNSRPAFSPSNGSDEHDNEENDYDDGTRGHVSWMTAASAVEHTSSSPRIISQRGSYQHHDNNNADEHEQPKRQDQVQSPVPISQPVPAPKSPIRKERKPVVYPLTPLQSEIFNLMSVDQPGNITQCHKMPMIAEVGTLKTCVARLLLDHKILASELFQNEKIIDADVEGIIPPNVTTVPVVEEVFVSEKNVIGVSRFCLDISQKVNFKKYPFRIYLIRNIKLEDTVSDVLLMMISQALCDDMGLSLIVRDLMKVLRMCQAWLREGLLDDEVHQQLVSLPLKNDDYQPESNQARDYVGLALNHRANPDAIRRGIAFCKHQVSETIQEHVNAHEKKKLEAEINRLGQQVTSFSKQRNIMVTRKGQLEIEYNKLKEQRVAMDEAESVNTVSVTIPAAIAGTPVRMSQTAWTALIRTVLGDAGAQDDVNALTVKHGLMEETRDKLRTKNISILDFACITEGNLNPLNLLTKEKRKVLALADYVRNRIKECLEGETKIKFDLERQLAKIKRQLEQSKDELRKSQDNLESADDMRMRLNNVLKPPMVDVEVPVVSVDGTQRRLGSTANLGSTSSIAAASKSSLVNNSKDELGILLDLDGLFGTVPVQFSGEIALSIFDYVVRRRKISSADRLRKLQQDNVDSDSSADDDDEDSCDDVAHPDAVCLAAFSILLKHIAGMEKYVVGITQDLRTKDIDEIGPYTNTLPLKIHFPQTGTTFHDLVLKLIHRLQHIHAHARHCPAPLVARQVGGLPCQGPPVRFQYIRRRELAGLDISEAELLQLPSSAALKSSLLWSASDDLVDLKFTVVETAQGGLIGALRYRRDKGMCDEDVSRWAEKLVSVLSGVDTTRQDTVATLISRFHSTVWASKDTLQQAM
ncbi:hypothetical protein SmJEL517_g00227 [Synchytrium microbalum]|uniref:Uncharacterized protein n=1 Tax=Synchytrium microbalum TaxID=1806994 RepID=A0A507CAV7_9FUNG|nr:uncharacterized protein SmJEL517_g00227 [Synchytrium microbalum]TPX38197.1 hypothetical protein SmJEL517_g00227 [Synchytrium microbalum]